MEKFPGNDLLEWVFHLQVISESIVAERNLGAIDLQSWNVSYIYIWRFH